MFPVSLCMPPFVASTSWEKNCTGRKKDFGLCTFAHFWNMVSEKVGPTIYLEQPHSGWDYQLSKLSFFLNFVRLHHFSHFWYSLVMIVNVSLPKHVPLIIRYCPIWLIPHTLKNNSVLTKKVNKTSILEFCFFFTLLIFSPLPSKWNFHPVLVLSPNESETLAADLTKSLAVKENWSEKVMWKWWEDLNKN